jgi:hypothetical protein
MWFTFGSNLDREIFVSDGSVGYRHDLEDRGTHGWLVRPAERCERNETQDTDEWTWGFLAYGVPDGPIGVNLHYTLKLSEYNTHSGPATPAGTSHRTWNGICTLISGIPGHTPGERREP